MAFFILQLSDGFNGADMRNVITEAGMFAIREDRCVYLLITRHDTHD